MITVEGDERIPLTIADSAAKAGTISLVLPGVGASTMRLGRTTLDGGRRFFALVTHFWRY